MDLMVAVVVVGRYLDGHAGWKRVAALLGTAACSTGMAAAATAATATAASDAPSTAFATDGWLVGVVARIARHLGWYLVHVLVCQEQSRIQGRMLLD